MAGVGRLIEILARELERPRELTPQVLRHVQGNYEIEREAVGAFLLERLPQLEDDEVDLILSPLFTPRLADQAVVAGTLQREALPRDAWPGIVQQLAARPVRTALLLDDKTYRVPLSEVIIERFVYRLRLDGAIPAPLASLIERAAPEADRPELYAVARRAVWESIGRRGILDRYMEATMGHERYRMADVLELLNLIESYKPENVDDLLARLPRWRQILQHTIETSGSSPFLNHHAEHAHGGDRDQRAPDPFRIAAKQDELAFLNRLEETLKS
ncbi:MAG TPA: hypothetical protein VFY29_08860 [Terriglobia bacterium]|nr:hypothetical protein [Terriglobia bacterium]